MRASVSIILGAALAGVFVTPVPTAAQASGADTSCIVMDFPVGDRPSPLDSLSFLVGGQAVKLCYGRPSARGRVMIGGKEVPYGSLWRTGANEPTMLHTTEHISVAGIELEPGSYSLYTIPGEEEWIVILNRSITQWGHIARYTHRVKSDEVGQAIVRRERPDNYVETLTFEATPHADGVDLVLEWEETRVAIRIVPAGDF